MAPPRGTFFADQLDGAAFGEGIFGWGGEVFGRWSDGGFAGIVDLNGGHHATVFVSDDVAVVDESADDNRVGEGDNDFHFATNRDDIIVAVSGELDGFAIDFHDLEIDLMDMELVEFVGGVANRPLFDMAERHAGIDAIFIEDLIIHAEIVVGFIENDQAFLIDFEFGEVGDGGGAAVGFFEGEIERFLGCARADDLDKWGCGVAIADGTGANLCGFEGKNAWLRKLDEGFDAGGGAEQVFFDGDHPGGGIAVLRHYPESLSFEGEAVVEIRGSVGDSPLLGFAWLDVESGVD